MNKEYVQIELNLGIEELEDVLLQIENKKAELWGLLDDAQTIANKYNLKITFK